MKLVRTLSLTLAMTLAAGGAFAKGDDKKPAPPADTKLTDADKADVQKWLAFFDKFVDTVVADKDDCKKMAGDITKLVDSNKELLQKAADAQAAGKKLPDDAQKHMMEGVQKMTPAMQKCGTDKDVQAAIMKMQPQSKKPAGK